MPSSSASSLIIFLDVDGVLVPVSPMSFGGGDFDPACISRLGEIVSLAGGAEHVTIVVSSTWRHDPAKMQRLNDAFRACLPPSPSAASSSNSSNTSAPWQVIPPVSLGVANGVPNPTRVVTYLKKDPTEQKLVKERVDEIAYFLEQYGVSEYPRAGISIVEPPEAAAAETASAEVQPPPPPSQLAEPPHVAEATSTTSTTSGKKKEKGGGGKKKDAAGGVGGGRDHQQPQMLPMRTYHGRWLAIDDMELPADPRMAGHCLKTDIEEGLQATDVERAQTLLASLPPPRRLPIITAAVSSSGVPAGGASSSSSGGDKEGTTKSDGGNDDGSGGVARPVWTQALGVPMEGLVKRYNSNRGFGFLRAGGQDIFVHQQQVQLDGFRGLNVAQPVTFEAALDAEGRIHAIYVQQLTPFKPTMKIDPRTGLRRQAGIDEHGQPIHVRRSSTERQHRLLLKQAHRAAEREAQKKKKTTAPVAETTASSAAPVAVVVKVNMPSGSSACLARATHTDPMVAMPAAASIAATSPTAPNKRRRKKKAANAPGDSPSTTEAAAAAGTVDSRLTEAESQQQLPASMDDAYAAAAAGLQRLSRRQRKQFLAHAAAFGNDPNSNTTADDDTEGRAAMRLPIVNPYDTAPSMPHVLSASSVYYRPPSAMESLHLPWIADGHGYRTANGTVFYPIAPPPYALEGVLYALPAAAAAAEANGVPPTSSPSV